MALSLESPQPNPTNPDALDTTQQAPVQTGFATSLQPTQERLAAMCDYAMQRTWEVAEEMGRDQSGEVRVNSWMGIRVQNRATYDNDLEWRKALGSIFTRSNFTLGDNRRYARLLSARVRADLLGTTPFFGAMSRQNGNTELTMAAEAFLQEQVDLSNVPSALREGVKTALIVNEAVVKTTYLKDVSPYLGPAYVGVDLTGRPIVSPKGLYVYPNDIFVPDQSTEGVVRLKKDPALAITYKPKFQQFTALPQVLTKYDNVFSQVLDCRDFLCPLKFRHTWQADINVHLYEEDPAVLAAIYGQTTAGQQYFSWRSDVTGAKKPLRMQGEHYEERSSVKPSILVGETYLRYDADGDGHQEEIMLVMDLLARQPIFYDYLGNHMPWRPFGVIPGVEREEGRWYGKGVFTKMYSSGMYIDTQINRINEKASQENSVTFRHRNAVDVWKAGEQVEFGSRKVFDVNEGWDAKTRPPLYRINLQSEAELDLKLVEVMRNASDSEFGVISNQAASAAGLNASKTATGVISTDKDASALSQDTESEVKEAIETILEQVAEVVFSQMDPMVMQYSQDGKALATLNKDDIMYLQRDVRLLLTKTRSAAMVATNEKAEAVWQRYLTLTPDKQQIGWDLYVKQLKGLEIDDAEKLCPRPTDDDVKAWRQQQAKAQQDERDAKDKPPAASVAAKLGDFEPINERPQIVRKFYEITPSDPAVVDAAAARTDATEVHKKVAIAEGTAEAKAEHAPPAKQPNSKR